MRPTPTAVSRKTKVYDVAVIRYCRRACRRLRRYEERYCFIVFFQRSIGQHTLVEVSPADGLDFALELASRAFRCSCPAHRIEIWEATDKETKERSSQREAMVRAPLACAVLPVWLYEGVKHCFLTKISHSVRVSLLLDREGQASYGWWKAPAAGPSWKLGRTMESSCTNSHSSSVRGGQKIKFFRYRLYNKPPFWWHLDDDN